MFRKRHVASIAALALAGAGLGIAPAQAATTRVKTCGVGNPLVCKLEFSKTSAGGVTVYVEVLGRQTVNLRWYLAANGRDNCYGDFKPSDPPRTWYCTYVPAGSISVRAVTVGLGATVKATF